jgi:RimJ/RimL family protein N-acetyltransferase
MGIAYVIGKKVHLRPLEREDAPTIVPWFNDPDVLRTIDRYKPMTLPEEEGFIMSVAGGEHDLVLGIAPAGEDRLVGVTGLHKIQSKNRTAVFGITIGDKREWGKCYGTEATWLMAKHAFETLNLNRLMLHVREHNERGIRAYERVGYKREGVLRQDTFVEGRYVNTIVMGLLREEWKKP